MSEECQHEDFIILTDGDGKIVKGCRICCDASDLAREGYKKANLGDDAVIRALLNQSPPESNPPWLKVGLTKNPTPIPIINPEFIRLGRGEPVGMMCCGGTVMKVYETSKTQ